MKKLLALFLLSALALGAAPVKQLPPMKFHGKPFFPIGVYDLAHRNAKVRLGDVDPELYKCGVNIAFFGNLGLPEDKMYPGYSHIVKAFERRKNDPEFAKIALIINLCGEFYAEPAPELTGSSRRKYKPLTPETLAKRQAFLAEAMHVLSKYPNIIGYSIDEPENTFTNYFRIARKDMDLDAGIGPALNQWLGWLKPFTQKHHPGALWMPVIAWWGTYKDVAPLYDVLLADQYPRAATENAPEFSSPLYEVSFDAARMVSAARHAGGGRTAIYVPPCFDILKGNWTFATRAEQRYLFFAPITRGAMGILAWRLNRASQEHRDKVVYPTLRELARFQEYFLGEWHDELVKSNRDTATVDYLKKFVKRDKLLNDDKEHGGSMEVLDFVPDVSHCLRKAANGKWMLLAVNNQRTPLSATFTMKLPFQPKAMTEAIANRAVPVAGGKFTDKFAPFGVHVYIIE